MNVRLLSRCVELAIEKGTGLAAEKGTGREGLAEGYQVKMGKLQEKAYPSNLEGSYRCSKWKTPN